MSRFDDLLKNAKGRTPAPPPAAPKEAPAPKPAPEVEPAEPPQAPPLPRRPGRPKGKKTDPDYEQVTAYVRRDVYGRVRSELWNRHGRKEFSELIGELLMRWLDGQTSD